MKYTSPMISAFGQAPRGLICLVTVMAISHSSASLMGLAEGYAVLGGSTVTNTGITEITGDVGVSPGTGIIDPTGIVLVGAIHSNNISASLAHEAASNAYDALAAMPVTGVLTGQNLGGLVLTPGVYFFASSAQLTGTLTLDGSGYANPVFVFQIGSTLTTASNALIISKGGANGGNIYFNVGSSATIGTDSIMLGTIIADQDITMNTGASLQSGRAIALIGGVTLNGNDISAPEMSAVPEPASSLALAGLLSSGFFVRNRRK